MPPTLSLATTSRACAQAFTQLYTILKDPQHEELSGLTQSAIADECGRFRIWAGNLGALQQLPSPTSLDHRLRQSPKIACHIHELLETLKDSLQDVYAIASGARVNRQAASPEDNEEDDEFNELDNISNSSETRGELSKLFEAQEIFESAKETINSLFRLSIIIRKASPRDRFAKALAARQNPFDEQFDISHVGHKFPLLEIKENQWLKERLGRAITQRRQFLRYAHEHRNKIGKEPNDVWAPEGQEDSKEQLLIVDWGGEDQKSKTALTNRSGAASTLAPTNASTLLPSALEKMEEDFHDDKSQTSYAMSMGDDIDDGKLHLPRLVDVAKGVSPFECPLCWTIQDLKEESSWRKHAFRDLRPYICTFEKCDVKLFSDRHDWFEHELQFHRTQWHCGFCVQEPYHTLHQFQKHLQKQHTQNLTEEQLQAVCEASQQPADRISASDCPFCKDWEIRLRRENPNIPVDETIVVSPAQFHHHVGSHMQQLALFAIPRGYLEEETAGVNSTASVAVAGTAARDSSKPRSTLGSFKTVTASAHSYPSSGKGGSLRAADDIKTSFEDAVTPEEPIINHNLAFSNDLNPTFNAANIQQPTPAMSVGFDAFDFARPFPGPPGAEQTLDYNALPDQMKLDFPAAEPLLIPNASRGLYFCTYEAEEGKTKLFGSKSDWKKHEKNFHETGKEYRCPNPSCSQTFGRKYDYYQHCNRHGNLNALPASEIMRELPQKTAFGCGFNHCKMVAYSWHERCNHVADHMKEGKTPLDWSYSNVIRNLFRQQQQNIHEISKIICHQKKIDRSRLSWLLSNTRELRQNLECGIFYPNVEVFVQKAIELSLLGASESPNQATALPNRSIISSQDSVQSADTLSMPQIQDFLMADSADFDGSTQFDLSQQASQLQLPFENQPQLPSPPVNTNVSNAATVPHLSPGAQADVTLFSPHPGTMQIDEGFEDGLSTTDFTLFNPNAGTMSSTSIDWFPDLTQGGGQFEPFYNEQNLDDGNNSNAARPFPCPLAPYSCPSTFATKNEWKRHVSTQHIRLGFWRCDLCPTTVDNNNVTTVYFNDFNREDLFTQHLYRMHAAPAYQSAGRTNREYPVTKENLSEHQTRCYKQLRSTPPRSTCLFCSRTFSGPGSWDARMEHVGRHLEKGRKAGGAPVDINNWQEDEVLKDWLISEGLIETDSNGAWRLGDGRPRREADDDGNEDKDAEDEDDKEINHRPIKLKA